MIVYQGYQQLNSLNGKIGSNRLGDFYVASAYNASHCGYQMYDYTSEKIVLAALQSGARYLEFNVFNSEFGDKAFPVVSMGYKTGEWKMMVNDTLLETIFQTIAKNAFTVYDGVNGVSNPDDPIFIGLNLNTNSNLSCINLIAFLITQYFSERLLDNRYSFQNSDKVADITEWIPKHPGGDIIMKGVGKDATSLFNNVGHDDYAKKMLKKYQIGILKK